MVWLEVKKVKMNWNLFDVTLTGPDIVFTRRFGREELTTLLIEFRKSGRIQIGNAEASVSSAAERTRILEMAEAEMRTELS
jgi:hypothetical protein